MKKISFLMVIAVFAVTAASLFAEEGKEKPNTVFQKMGDAISQPIQMEVKPLKEMKTFQSMSDGIREGSKEAKAMSLRRPKQ